MVDQADPPVAARRWPALLIEAPSLDEPPNAEDLVAALLDDFALVVIEDLAPIPLPPGGLWDPTFPPIPEPPPTPLRWRVFFQTADQRDCAAVALRAASPHFALTATDVDDDDWAARSQASLTAVEAGRFIVAPPWDLPTDVPAGTTVIVIEPSMGFGTGHHATTRLCLRLLSDVDTTGRDVLDIGTGSGVLAMAASLTGAHTSVGVDVDGDAIASALHSAAMNPLPPSIEFRVTDFRTDPTMTAADVVLANLTGGMLTMSGAALVALVRPGGTLIVSGFDHDEAARVRAALAPLVEEASLQEDIWMAIRWRR